MLFAILVLKRSCNTWKGMKCSNLELRATSLLKPISQFRLISLRSALDLVCLLLSL